MAECPTPDQLAELTLGRLLEPTRSEVEEHVATCAACRRVVASLARSSVLPPAPPGESLEAGRAFGRFTVIRTLGAGAMGTVYCAHDPQLDRRVALKVLHAHVDSARLLTEARAMARVADPNVTHVHEVASAEDRVYLAMELVEGVTLRRWLAEQPRGWAEVLPKLLQAGAGLAAAHDAGVTHLDFKPENVLVGTDGRVRVTDFGLARIRALPLPLDAAAALDDSHAPGTPAYMSPEQFAGERCGPAADQFSFCVVAWEALFRESPFDAGEPPTVAALARAVGAGRLRAPSHRHGVPRAVRRALERGLSREPNARFESVRALLSELERPLAPTRSRALFVAMTLALVALMTVGAWSQRARWLCGGGVAQLGTAWDEAQRQRAQAAFEASDAAWAGPAWSAGQTVLTHYRESWLEMFRESCEATRVSGEQSSEVLELRLACLATRRQELEAVGAVLASGDGATFSRALSLADGLTPLSTCADVEGLRSQVRPPADTSVRGAVSDTLGVLADALALERAGRYPQALGRAREALSLAELTKYAPIIATARGEVGRLQLSLEPDDRATVTLETAFYEAQACGHDELAGRVAALLVMHTGLTMKRREDAQRWERMARAMLKRRPVLLNELLLETGRTRWLAWEHQFDEALAAGRRSVTLSTQVFGAQSPNTAARESDVGRVLSSMERTDEALAEFRRSLATFESTLGPQHPEAAATRNGIANALLEAGRLDEALAEQRRVLAIVRASNGPSSDAAGLTLSNIAELDAMQGRHQEALAGYQQALQIALSHGGAADPMLAQRYGDVASELEALERLPEAIEAMKQACTSAEQAHATNLEAAVIRCDLARLEATNDELASASRDAELALRALEGREGEEPDNVAGCRFIAAKLFWAKDRVRARRLVQAARAGLADDSELALEIDAWLKTAPSR